MNFVLRFPKLSGIFVKIGAYSDASYIVNADLTLQLEFIPLLTDKDSLCQPTHWSSHEAKEVTRSILESKQMELKTFLISSIL